MSKQRARLPDTELNLLEDTIAAAVGITNDAKALLYWITDPDQIHIVSLILEKASWIRKQYIEEMERRKVKVKRPTGATVDLVEKA